MSTRKLHTRLLFIMFDLLISTKAEPKLQMPYCPNETAYATNDAYQSNLNTVLFYLSSNSTLPNLNGFYNSSAGAPRGEVAYGLFLCRGDLSSDVCQDCVTFAAKDVLHLCPNKYVAMLWYEECFLRISNQTIFSRLNTQPRNYYDINENNVTLSERERFNNLVRTTLLETSTVAAMAPTGDKKFKVKETSGNGNFSDFDNLYTLVQCTPDLSTSDCVRCLQEAISIILPVCCDGRKGGTVLSPSCNFQYELSIFYNSTAAVTLSPPRAQLAGKKSNDASIVIFVVVASSAAVAVLVICIWFFRRKRKSRTKLEIEDTSPESLKFDFATIRAATDNFSDANKLGQGGFGAVYKGRISDGDYIAVKRLSKNSGQGYLEFKNEVLLLAKLQHRNLVKLLGFCLEGNERLLIYEFVPNASLDHFLFDPVRRGCLNWEVRCKIIGGLARGLVYLHEDSRQRIIHRDLKASNVLLDEDMNPKIADFGMARLFVEDQTHADTGRIVGTRGYMAPEYVLRGHFSVKSDVFSFGALVLEIVTGLRNNSFRDTENDEDLLSYAWRNWREGSWANLLDPILTSGSRNEMKRCIHVGLLCVQENVVDRPNMTTVVLMLNSHSLTLPMPSRPSFAYSIYGSDMSASTRPNLGVAASNEASITEIYPR